MTYLLIYLFFVILILNKYRILQERELESQADINLGLIKIRGKSIVLYGELLEKYLKLKNKQNNQ